MDTTGTEVAKKHSGQPLTDERIEELLKEAEARLRAEAGLEPQQDDSLALQRPTASTTSRSRLPRLDSGLQQPSYLKNQNGVTRTNSSLTVPDTQRKMADGLRTLPRNISESKKVVSPSSLLGHICMRKLNPKLFLDAHQRLFLRLPCLPESVLYS